LRTIKNKWVALFSVIAFFVATTSTAWATDNIEDTLSTGRVTNLSQGERAPFAGILLSDSAAAKLFADLEFTEKECQLRLTRELDIVAITSKSQIDALSLRLEVETERTERLLAIKDERIEFLEENWKPQPWYESGEFWFGMGVVGGVLITVGSAYALSHATR
jgi:hypothetical protein